MITEADTIPLSSVDRSQLHRIELARGSWAVGQIDNALLLIEDVKREELNPRVTAECVVAEAAFRMDSGDLIGSGESLRLAAPVIDHAPLSVQGAFYHQRGRIKKEAGDLDGAFTDYAGAEACWEEIGASEKVGAVALNLAGVCLRLSDFSRAHEYALKSIALFTKTNSLYISQAHDTEAQTYLAEGKLRAALASIDLALDLSGENEGWRKDFTLTKDRIFEAVVNLIHTAGVKLTELQKEMVRCALIRQCGNVTRASKDVGMSRKGVSDLIDRHKELEPYRVDRRVRNKSLMKKT
ncbi:MAG TPA: tetratricopeptide repeat protein [Polyangiaceae bacterium]|nr:tetratricopeptide repeat protein [Polyangiaceae bacterium]